MSVLRTMVDRTAPEYAANRAALLEKIAELDVEQAKAVAGGGEKYVARHHKRGKLLVRERIDLLADEDWTREETVNRVRQLYEFRRRRFKIRAGKLDDDEEADGGTEERSMRYQRLMHEIYAAQRRALVGLRNSSTISTEVMRRLERELDLEESRLEV